MPTLGESRDALAVLNQLTVPDLWQQEAISALREGADVVVHAPTGSGKTLIFEHWSNQGKLRGQAIYTVPTRALANDKLAEWRARGWNVGIATGDLAENLRAPILVATLETQKNRLIQGDGPTLLVIDEYQMLGDPDRGLNYELALAMAPPQTQLLLLSGSVANPDHVVRWLERVGRRAVLVRHDVRPVPLEEVFLSPLPHRLSTQINGYWPRFVAAALREDYGPLLLFAPQRRTAESLAADLARHLPNPLPLELTDEQRELSGHHLSSLLESRIAYHHSGLSYGVRAGVIEPLAKAGQLRAVVATMGLAAGINFSLRSVALAGDTYRRGSVEQNLRPDEILQMFGRAGRRGIDEIGYAIVSANKIRLMEGYPAFLARSGMVDWGALLGVMHAAAADGRPAFEAAVQVQERLFTTKPIVLGVEVAMKHPDVPCGLQTDAERARYRRKKLRQILNSDGRWQASPRYQARPLNAIRILQRDPETGSHELIPILSTPDALAKFGDGDLVAIDNGESGPVYGRAITVAERRDGERIQLAKTLKRWLGWKGRYVSPERWREKVVPKIERRMASAGTPVVKLVEGDDRIVVWLDISSLKASVPVDELGVALWKPPRREVTQTACRSCALNELCAELSGATGVAMLWRRFRLIDDGGRPTLRGRVVSFFGQGQGLGIAAALEDESYPLDELVYDLANIDAGFRFCKEDTRWEGRLAVACRAAYGYQNVEGYLENGLPPGYGFGAERIVQGVHRDPQSKNAWVSVSVGPGDIDRVIIEWRSLMRRIAHSSELDWSRWTKLQQMAQGILRETKSPTDTELPSLPYSQRKRVNHRLVIRR